MNKKIELKDLWPIIEEKIDSGGSATINPGGISMLPLVKAGRDSVVIVKPGSVLKKYDVALYKRKNGQFVLHRVVGVSGETYTMCGDNQCFREPGISHDAVLAVMTDVIRKGKKINVNNLIYKIYSFIIVDFQRINCFLRKVYRRIRKK